MQEKEISENFERSDAHMYTKFPHGPFYGLSDVFSKAFYWLLLLKVASLVVVLNQVRTHTFFVY